MRTISLEINNTNRYSSAGLAFQFNRRLSHIDGRLTNVTILVDEYGSYRGFGDIHYDYLTLQLAGRWGMHMTFIGIDGKPVTVNLGRLVSEGGVKSRMDVLGVNPTTLLNADYIKEHLLQDEINTITHHDAWEVVTDVMQAYASVLATRTGDIAQMYLLPEQGEANVSLVMGGRQADNLNHYYTTMYHKEDGSLFVDTNSRWYGSGGIRDTIENILHWKHYQRNISTHVINSWLPISWFINDLVMRVHRISRSASTFGFQSETDRLAVYDVPQVYSYRVTAVRGLHGIQRALETTYFHRADLQQFFGFDFAQCAVTKKYFAAEGADPDLYEGLYTMSPINSLKPVSQFAIRRVVSELIIDEQCNNCDSVMHVQKIDFFKSVQDRYEDVFGKVGEFEPDHYHGYRFISQTSTQEIRDVYETLYDIAGDEHPDYAPDYYCNECERGEDYYEDEDNDHRNEYLGSTTIDTLNEIATTNNKQLYVRDGFAFFVKDMEQFGKDFVWRNYNRYEINDYSFRPNLTFVNGDCMDKTKLYMGVEWEMDGGGEMHRKAIPINSALSNNHPYSWTMTDGSLQNGMEIATMPATLDAHLNVFNWDMACKTAVSLNYRGHDTSTAGIHVHINRNFFSDDRKMQLYRASLMALIMERNWEDFVKFTRRRYNRLDQWAKKQKLADNLNPDITTDGMVTKVMSEYGNGDKYLALNLRNSDTFELRIFRSTLKADSIKATLQFVSNFAHWCKYNNLAKAQTATIDDIINYKEYPELKEYWEQNKNREVNE